MKTVSIKLSDELESIRVDNLGDLHIGSPSCEIEAIKAEIETIKNEKTRYCVINGDIINNSTTHSVGDTYTETLTPMQQVKLVSDLLMPIKDKILAITMGNHERRSYKESGVDLTYFVAKELGIDKLYDPAGVVTFLRFGSIPKADKDGNRRHTCWTLYTTHGSGGGSTKGGKANSLQKRGNVLDADVIFQGHTHDGITFRTVRFICDSKNDSIIEREQGFVNGSSFLGYEEYAEIYGYAPSSNHITGVILSGNETKRNFILLG